MVDIMFCDGILFKRLYCMNSLQSYNTNKFPTLLVSNNSCSQNKEAPREIPSREHSSTSLFEYTITILLLNWSTGTYCVFNIPVTYHYLIILKRVNRANLLQTNSTMPKHLIEACVDSVDEEKMCVSTPTSIVTCMLYSLYNQQLIDIQWWGFIAVA